jgi:7-carboxy-7-deazaguanine synthase
MYAQEPEPANWMTIDKIVSQVHFPKVTITGGEALLQRSGTVSLIQALRKIQKKVSIETNGSILIPLAEVSYLCHLADDKYVRWVVDWKLPSSGMEDKMNLNVFSSLRDIDVIKFVISDEKDYKRACELIEKNPNWRAKMVFSPMMELVERNYWGATGAKLNLTPELNMSWPRQLVEMMIRDKIPAQFSLQLHKLLWPGAKEER